MTEEGPLGNPASPGLGFCEERYRLLNEFLSAVREILEIQHQQAEAAACGDTDFVRFDVLLHMAMEKKEQAKYAWMAHVEAHQCEEEI